MEAFTVSDLLLKDGDPALPYYARASKKGVFWGQRKLLMTEIFFLADFSLQKSLQPIVVYAGAAGGSHIELLKILFPLLRFELYDPRNFDVKPDERTNIHQEFFTDFTAQYWASQNVPILFISDIRSADWEELTEEETELQIMNDMRAQERWVWIMQPLASFLKFRLPWSARGQVLEVPYLRGIIMKQPWARLASTEARLIPTDKSRIYDAKTYEDQMFHHNAIIREQKIWLQYKFNSELNGFYDATAEVFILTNYLTKAGLEVSVEKVNQLSTWISLQLGGTIERHYEQRGSARRRR